MSHGYHGHAQNSGQNQKMKKCLIFICTQKENKAKKLDHHIIQTSEYSGYQFLPKLMTTEIAISEC